MALKIAAWNVNSILARLPTALKVFEAVGADIWCLQEIKCEDARFPRLEFETMGYNIETHGQKSYNGVAILSKHRIEEHVRANNAKGRGVVMLSAHVGNAELAGQGLIPLGIPCFAVTEPIEPAALRRMMNKIRSTHGVEFEPVGVASAKRIVRILRDGGTVALMGDRDISGPRMRLPFFGEDAWMPTGPVEVALRTGAVAGLLRGTPSASR